MTFQVTTTDRTRKTHKNYFRADPSLKARLQVIAVERETTTSEIIFESLEAFIESEVYRELMAR